MTTHGARANNRPPMVEDLDALLVSRSLRPAKVKFAGREWTIKRDFTAPQIIEFWLLQGNKTPESLTKSYAMVVGAKDAPGFYEIVMTLPDELGVPAFRRLLQLAGLLKRPEVSDDSPDSESDSESEGESSASSTES